MADHEQNSGHSLKYWLEYGEKLLAESGIREPELDARILLEYAANINRSYYYLHMHDFMEVSDVELYRYLLMRRAEREPLQYLTEEAPFYGEVFYVNPHVLIPRQDTEVLVEEAEKRIRTGMVILDLCTGSGCVLLSLARRNSITAIGSDVSTAALAVAEQNRKRLGVRASWIESNLFERIGGTFDMIISNPPYIAASEIPKLEPEVRDHEPYAALEGGFDGLQIVRTIIEEAGAYLRPSGWLLLEIGYDQGEKVRELLTENEYDNVSIVPDLEGRDRVAIGKRRI